MHRPLASPGSSRRRPLRLYWWALVVGVALLGLGLATILALRWLRPQPELRLRLMPAAAPLSALGDVTIAATGWRRHEEVTLCVAAEALLQCPEETRIGVFKADSNGLVEARAPLAPLFGRGLTYVIGVGKRSGAVAQAFRVLQEPSPIPGRRSTYLPTATPTPYAGQVVLPVVEGGSSGAVTPSPVPTPTPAPAAAGWQAEYFANPNLAGPPAFTSVDAALVFDWGRASPSFRVPPDNFSARWTRTISTLGRRYDFEVRADDGVRVYIDGRLLLDEWHPVRPNPTYTFSVDLTPGDHLVVVEYYEGEGEAFIEVTWREADTYPDWRGEYFDNPDLAGEPRLVRNDLAVDFAWGEGSPIPGFIPEDGFSVRWTRNLELPAGVYRFEAQADDSFRLYVDDQLVLAGADSAFVDLPLAAGFHWVRLEYVENVGEAAVMLQWYPSAPEAPPTAPVGPDAQPIPTPTGPAEGGTPTPAPTVTPEVRAVTLTPTSGWAGTLIRVDSAGWPPNIEVFLALLEPLASIDQADDITVATVNAAGQVSFLFEFPDEPRWLSLPQVQIILHDEAWQVRGTTVFTLMRP